MGTRMSLETRRELLETTERSVIDGPTALSAAGFWTISRPVRIMLASTLSFC